MAVLTELLNVHAEKGESLVQSIMQFPGNPATLFFLRPDQTRAYVSERLLCPLALGNVTGNNQNTSLTIKLD